MSFLFSLDGGRIELNKANPNECRVTFQHVKETDSGTWNIITTVCSRGRGKYHDKALLDVQRSKILF